jgi:hypothetical protein
MARTRAETPDLFHGFVTPQASGVLRLPNELRERLMLSQPGVQLEVTERLDGVVELRGVVPVPVDQQWFWTQRWQQMEREADADIAAGRVVRADSAKEMLGLLDK